MKQDEPYLQYVPGPGLSLERNTSTVPKDGWYYVIRDGEIISRSKSLTQAQKEYIAIRVTLVEHKTADASVDSRSLALDNYFAEKELYWSQSHSFRRGGGKGGRGGI